MGDRQVRLTGTLTALRPTWCGNRNGPEEHDERMEATAWVDRITSPTTTDGPLLNRRVQSFCAGNGSGKDALKGQRPTSDPSVKAGMTGGWVWQLSTEESTKSVDGRRRNPAPFAPSGALHPRPARTVANPDRASQLTRSETCTDQSGQLCPREGDQ